MFGRQPKIKKTRDNKANEGNDAEPVKPAKRGFIPSPLVKIYQDDDGQPLNMTHLEKSNKKERRERNPRSKRILIIIIGLLAVLLGVSLWGFFVFTGHNKFSGENLKVSLEMPAELVSGEEFTFTATISNKEKVGIKKAVLNLSYPDGFYFKSAEPVASNEFNNAWDLGNLRPGAGAKIRITGQLVGEVGSSKIFSSSLAYRPANFNSDFEEKASKLITISSSILSLETTAPTSIGTNSEFDLVIKYKNNAATPLEKVKLMLEAPEQFTFLSSTPQAQENNSWQFEKLEAGQEGEIKVHGLLKTPAGQMEEFKIKIGLLDSQDNFKLQQEKSALVLVINPDIELKVQINNQENLQKANWGDELNYIISYKNNGEVELKDAIITIELKGQNGQNEIVALLDYAGLTSNPKGKLNGNKLSWTSQEIEALKSLKPGASGQITFKVKLITNPTIQKSTDKNFEVISSSSLTSANTANLGNNGFNVKGNEITTKISSQLRLTAEGRYYSDEYEQLGSGPLPPTVGQKTTYRIYWYLTNSTNDLKDVEVSSTLPAGVTWTGVTSVSAGEALSYDPATGKVIWRLNKIPANTGRLFSTLSAYFDLSVIPTIDQVGQYLNLTAKTNAKATDDFTTESLTVEKSEITSELPDDLKALGKGQVVAANSNTNTNLNQNINSSLNSNLNANLNSNTNQ